MYIVYMSPVAHFTWIYVKIIIWETNCLRQTKLLVLVHVEKIFHWNYRDCPYCGIIFIRWANLLLVCWDIILWVIGLLHYYLRQFITLLYIRGEVNSCVRVNHKIHHHWSPTSNDNSTVTVLACKICIAYSNYNNRHWKSGSLKQATSSYEFVTRDTSGSASIVLPLKSNKSIELEFHTLRYCACNTTLYEQTNMSMEFTCNRSTLDRAYDLSWVTCFWTYF